MATFTPEKVGGPWGAVRAAKRPLTFHIDTNPDLMQKTGRFITSFVLRHIIARSGAANYASTGRVRKRAS